MDDLVRAGLITSSDLLTHAGLPRSECGFTPYAGWDRLPVGREPWWAFHVHREPVRVDLGGVALTVEPDAQELLDNLPAEALEVILREVRRWAHDRGELRGARIVAADEPEDPAWREAVLELIVESSSDAFLRLWAELAERVDRVKEGLPSPQRHALNRAFGVQLVWPENASDL